MFASEYVVASFEDVRRVFEKVSSPSPFLRITGGMRPRSSTVASVPIEWSDPASPAEWQAAELRIIRVQSGNAPLTELLLVMPTQESTADARLFLAWLGQRVEESVATVPGQARRPLAAGWR